MASSAVMSTGSGSQTIRGALISRSRLASHPMQYFLDAVGQCRHRGAVVGFRASEQHASGRPSPAAVIFFFAQFGDAVMPDASGGDEGLRADEAVRSLRAYRGVLRWMGDGAEGDVELLCQPRQRMQLRAHVAWRDGCRSRGRDP